MKLGQRAHRLSSSCFLDPATMPWPQCKRFRYRLLLTVIIQIPGRDIGARTADGTFPCDGLSAQALDVETTHPEFRGALGWWRKLARSVELHHQTTAQGLVRRFVTLDPGLRCTEFRRSESERILRAQPFLA